MTRIHLKRTLDAWRVSLRTTDETFFEQLEKFKFGIPVHLRQYDPSTKEWVVDPYAEKELRRWIRIVETEGGRVTIDDEEPKPKRRKSYRRPDWRPEPRTISPYQRLCLTPDAPIEVVRAAKKALATIYHPDRPTGDLEKMKAINDAVDQIEKRRSA